MHFDRHNLARLTPVLAMTGGLALLWWAGAFRRLPSPNALQTSLVIGAALFGLTARSKAARRHAASRILFPGVVLAAALGLATVEIHTLATKYSLDHSAILSLAAIFFVAPVLLGGSLSLRRPVSGFAVGAVLVLALAGPWYVGPFWAGLMPVAFLLVRDAGTIDRTVPARQSLSLVGLGALFALVALAITFDLHCMLRYDPGSESIMQSTWLDAPHSRWLRIATEVCLLGAAYAHASGRSWGIPALVGLGVALAMQLLVFDLPGWRSGCTHMSHPFEGTVLIFAALALAVGPWLVPLFRKLQPKWVRPARSGDTR